MPPDWLLIPIAFAGGTVPLVITWVGFVRRPASEDRFATTVTGVWTGVSWLAAAGLLLCCKLSGRFDRSAMMFASAVAMFGVSAAMALSLLLRNWAKRWYKRMAHRFPDFAEDDTGNPVRPPGGG